MTADELIKALSALPPETPIHVHNAEFGTLSPARLAEPTRYDVSKEARGVDVWEGWPVIEGFDEGLRDVARVFHVIVAEEPK